MQIANPVPHVGPQRDVCDHRILADVSRTVHGEVRAEFKRECSARCCTVGLIQWCTCNQPSPVPSHTIQHSEDLSIDSVFQRTNACRNSESDLRITWAATCHESEHSSVGISETDSDRARGLCRNAVQCNVVERNVLSSYMTSIGG